MAVVGAILRGPGIIQTSLTAVLRERASLQPHDPAFTFVDYDSQWDGVAEELTWAQLYRRVADLAAVLRERTAPGDRAAVLAPQNLHYVIGYLAALEAGLIAVPLSTPAPGFSDERVLAVLADAAPTVLLTDSAAAAAVAAHAGAAPEATIIEVDRLPEPAPRAGARRRPTPEVAYLQYTSGSTRTPAGVMVSHANLVANYRQMIRYFFPHHGGVAPADTTVVSWLPFYHDMGLLLGVCAPILGGWHTVFTSPLAFLARPARWLQLLAAYPSALTAAPNFAFDLAAARVSDDDLPRRRPEFGARGDERRRTGAARLDGSLHPPVRPAGAVRRGDPAVLRPGRGDAVRRDGRPGRRADRRELRSGPARPGAGPPQ